MVITSFKSALLTVLISLLSLHTDLCKARSRGIRSSANSNGQATKTYSERAGTNVYLRGRLLVGAVREQQAGRLQLAPLGGVVQRGPAVLRAARQRRVVSDAATPAAQWATRQRSHSPHLGTGPPEARLA
jgi:hypothetical protein